MINTDEELVKKYSKVSFLNEHYAPKKLSHIKDEYVLNSKSLQLQSDVNDYLEKMIEDAADDDIELGVVSGYRSFGEQASIKYNYTVLYGSGANTFSADQGYSEHQLGTTVDLSTPAIGTSLTTAFDQTPAFAWLEDNAYKYGFVLSYDKGNAYYQYEPWHWRFVSKDMAKDLHRSGETFYEQDQRELLKYLADFFE